MNGLQELWIDFNLLIPRWIVSCLRFHRGSTGTVEMPGTSWHTTMISIIAVQFILQWGGANPIFADADLRFQGVIGTNWQ